MSPVLKLPCSFAWREENVPPWSFSSAPRVNSTDQNIAFRSEALGWQVGNPDRAAGAEAEGLVAPCA
jgi:hypothetical protein